MGVGEQRKTETINRKQSICLLPSTTGTSSHCHWEYPNTSQPHHKHALNFSHCIFVARAFAGIFPSPSQLHLPCLRRSRRFVVLLALLPYSFFLIKCTMLCLCRKFRKEFFFVASLIFPCCCFVLRRVQNSKLGSLGRVSMGENEWNSPMHTQNGRTMASAPNAHSHQSNRFLHIIISLSIHRLDYHVSSRLVADFSRLPRTTNFPAVASNAFAVGFFSVFVCDSFVL